MIDFAEIEQLRLTDPGGLARLDAILGEVAGFAETRSAAEIARLLEQRIQRESVLAATVEPMIAKFRVLAIPLLTDDQVVDALRHVASVMQDERISLYERLRAKLIVLPPGRKAGFAKQLYELLAASKEPIGAPGQTVGWWVEKCVTGGSVDPEACFRLADFRSLDDSADHAVRHLVHLLTLAVPTKSSTPTPEPSPTSAAKPVAIPPNLPIEPTAAPAATIPVRPPVETARQPMVPLNPPKPVTDVRGPSVAAVLAKLQQTQQTTTKEPPSVAHLTPDDHEEIRDHAERISGFDVGPNVHDALSDTLNAIIAKANVTFSDENLDRRFRTILTTRLRDIRNSPETIELLTRPEKIGGLALNPSVAQSVVEAAEREAGKFDDADEVRRMATALEKKASPPLPTLPKVPVAPPTPPAPAPARPLTIPVQPMSSGMPIPPSPPVAPDPRPAPSPFLRPSSIPPAAPTRVSVSLRPSVADRTTVSDIRGASRLTGPVEELRQMTLDDYRRLGEDSVGSIRRVYEKIQRLGQESFSQKAEGVKAWRDSVVYRLYLELGQESLMTGKPVAEVIANRSRQSQETLTEQEFTLVADLNRKLRF